MKILFISSGKGIDYMSDTIFHGLKSLYGKNVYENVDHHYLFDDSSSDCQKSLYGKGFTVGGNLDSDLKNVLSNKEIKKLIKEQFFDLIIYGSIWRSNDYFSLVSKKYPREKIIFIDGEDRTKIQKYYLNRGIYFKRELIDEIENVFPIGFGIPESKIVKAVPDKKNIMAYIIPDEPSTYIYDTEKQYYDGYKKSCFGLTKKKAGWDCLRHYEIMANGCIPYFINLKECPKQTMHLFPKELIIQSNNEFDTEIMELSKIKEISKKLLDHTENFLTTEKIVIYMINTVINSEKISSPTFSSHFIYNLLSYKYIILYFVLKEIIAGFYSKIKAFNNIKW